jgi:signal peptidase II
MQTEAGAPLTSDDPDPASGTVSPGAVVDPAVARRNFVVVLALGSVWVLIDQLTKIWAVDALTDREPVPVVGELLQLRLLYNPGAAFSLGTGSTWIFTVLATVVVVIIIWQARHLGSRGWAIALGLLLGGAAGNLVDRLTREPGFGRGYVVDFLALPNFPVFNVADIGITCAATLIILLALRGIGLDGRRESDEIPEATP